MALNCTRYCEFLRLGCRTAKDAWHVFFSVADHTYFLPFTGAVAAVGACFAVIAMLVVVVIRQRRKMSCQLQSATTPPSEKTAVLDQLANGTAVKQQLSMRSITAHSITLPPGGTYDNLYTVVRVIDHEKPEEADYRYISDAAPHVYTAYTTK